MAEAIPPVNPQDRSDPSRDASPAFKAKVAEWIAASGEVLVLLRYLRAAGRKGFALCRSRDEFERLVDEAPIGTDIEVFRDPQLGIRGTVTGQFVDSALASMCDGIEYLLVTQERVPGSVLCAEGAMGETLADLRADLRAFSGKAVALGPCPDYGAPDGDGLISASKGGIDGPR